MYVCICNAITEQQIRDLAAAGCRDLGTLQNELGVAAGCGTCMETALGVLNDATPSPQRANYPAPRLYQPQLA